MKYLLTLSFFIFIFLVWFFYEKQIDLNTNQKQEDVIPEEIKLEILTQEQIKKNIANIDNFELPWEKSNSWVEIFETITGSKTDSSNIKIIDLEKQNELKNKVEINILKDNFSSNINNIIKFSWENLDQIRFVNIWEHSFIPELIDWFLYILVEENNYLNWEYFVIFQMKDWSVKTLDKKIEFSLSFKNLVVNDITPKVLKNDIARNIILQWKWFLKIISIQLSNNIVLKSTSFEAISDNVLIIKIPENLEAWKYSLNIMDTQWINKPNIQITINN